MNNTLDIVLDLLGKDYQGNTIHPLYTSNSNHLGRYMHGKWCILSILRKGDTMDNLRYKRCRRLKT
jgi:hypothetical protein